MPSQFTASARSLTAVPAAASGLPMTLARIRGRVSWNAWSQAAEAMPSTVAVQRCHGTRSRAQPSTAPITAP